MENGKQVSGYEIAGSIQGAVSSECPVPGMSSSLKDHQGPAPELPKSPAVPDPDSRAQKMQMEEAALPSVGITPLCTGPGTGPPCLSPALMKALVPQRSQVLSKHKSMTSLQEQRHSFHPLGIPSSRGKAPATGPGP